jgi:hypothetical protein
MASIAMELGVARQQDSLRYALSEGYLSEQELAVVRKMPLELLIRTRSR